MNDEYCKFFWLGGLYFYDLVCVYKDFFLRLLLNLKNEIIKKMKEKLCVVVFDKVVS